MATVMVILDVVGETLRMSRVNDKAKNIIINNEAAENIPATFGETTLPIANFTCNVKKMTRIEQKTLLMKILTILMTMYLFWLFI
ncbi:hypothetical protein L1267_11055 [Pseudoalteromonas sp. OFAV1]|uniref:hypothetical protein n=1 Tax=Pseudoalteromonas sp. OFAV1 TaxID=2908892 RepID=UPI001F47D537|nr:hypothetical protein [Pseudoalteromonas sp. OFAV1]MCF2900942.1 hypothetical protein [Pseudoalteromonas sp. OFAV1]